MTPEAPDQEPRVHWQMITGVLVLALDADRVEKLLAELRGKLPAGDAELYAEIETHPQLGELLALGMAVVAPPQKASR